MPSHRKLNEDRQAPRREPKVLVAEPSAYLRETLRAILTRRGMRQVTEAADGAEAVSALDLVAPDLLILDWQIPIIAAAEVMRLAREAGVARSANVRALVCMSEPTRERVDAAIASGAHAIVARPFSALSIWSRFAELI